MLTVAKITASTECRLGAELGFGGGYGARMVKGVIVFMEFGWLWAWVFMVLGWLWDLGGYGIGVLIGFGCLLC